MATTVGSLLVALGLDSAEFKSGLTQAEKEFKRSARRIENIGKSMQNIGRNLSLAVTAPLVAMGVAAVRGAQKQAAAVAQVNAALTSMGAVAGKTSAELVKIADAMEMRSLFDADEILTKLTANMLTFGNVAGVNFDRAQQAALDLATRMGGDLQSAAIMVGKALNAPAQGLAALRRVGIQFTADQEKQIKAMVAVGNTAGAQAVMLGELERQFGGAAQAAADTSPWRKLQVALGQAGDAIGDKLIPVLQNVTDAIVKVLDAFRKLPDGMQSGIIVAAALAAALGPVLIVLGSITRGLAPFIAGIKLATDVVNAQGVATTRLGTSLAVLRASLVTVASYLIPLAAALGVVSAAVYLLNGRASEASQKLKELRDRAQDATETADRMEAQLRAAGVAIGEIDPAAREAAKGVDLFTRSMTFAINKARELAKSAAIAQIAMLGQRQLEVQQERRKIGTRVAVTAGLLGGTGGVPFNTFRNVGPDKTQQDQLRALDAEENALIRQMKAVTAGVVNGIDIMGTAVDTAVSEVEAVSGGGGGGGGGASREVIDRTAEIERRFNDELIGYTQQALGAMGRLAKNADERAELELRSLEWARRQTLAQIAADEDYNDAQKAELSAAVERLADYERAGIDLQHRLELEREAADLAQVAFDSQREQLALAGDIADTQADRKRIALDILALEQEYRRNMLELVIASETATDAEKARAQAILDSLAAIEAGERASVGRANETEVERYLRHLRKSPEQISEELDRIRINGLESLNDALVDAMVNFRSLRDTVQSVVKSILADLLRLQIQQMIIRPLAQAMGLGVPGFARGTNFAPGGLAIVGERGPELVNLPRGSQVIPNHELRGMSGSASVTINASFAGMSEREMREASGQLARRMRRELNGAVAA